MSLDGFMLICPRGHDEVTLWGQEALDHVQTCHGRKPGTVWVDTTNDRWGGVLCGLRAWKPCDEVVKARPWKAPRAPQKVPAAFLAKLDTDPDVTHEYVTDDERAA